MKLTVIIPTYNRSETLPRAIESVLNQHNTNVHQKDHGYELFVVDDGSTDDTRQLLLSEYPMVKYLHQSNAGVSAARNLGLQHAKGEWIAFLDSDDEWMPNKLDAQFTALEETGLRVCHTEEIWVRNGVRVNQMKKHQKYGGDIFQQCLPLCAMSPSSIMIHRSVFEYVGTFDELLPACEDYDLWLRIAARFQVAYVPQACIRKYGGHDDQLSRAFWGMDRFRVIALEKLLRQNQTAAFLDDRQRKAALTTMAKKNKILLQGAIKHGNLELQQRCEDRIEYFGL